MSAPTMEMPPPVDRDNLGQGPTIMAVTWIFQIIALVVVAARLLVRKAKEVAWGWDDYLMALAVLIQLAIQSLVTNSFTHGLGKHDRSLYPDEMMLILEHNYVSIPPGVMVSLLSRTSIAILLIRLFPPYKWFTYYLISFTGLMWVTGIVLMPITFLQATPTEALWNFTIQAEGRWDPRVWLYTTYFFQSCCTFSDLTYALFPVIFIWNLNMSLKQRLSLMAVMAGSILSMTMSILKTISMGEIANAAPGTPDTQYNSSLQLIYGFTEQTIVIIMGCIPPLRTVMKLDMSRFSLIKRYYSYRSKQSETDYSASGYTDLESAHKLGHVHSKQGMSQASVGKGSNRSSQYSGSNDHLVVPPGHISRTDKYSVTREAV